MQAHPFDALTLENGAKLIFTPCPGKKEATIAESVTTLKQAGTNVLITLMFDEEMTKNNALSLPAECADQGIEWLQLPIADDEAPNSAFEAPWLIQQDTILSVLKNKGTIAVHCKGGSGRTGLMIGLILLAYGFSSEEAIAKVKTLRPKAFSKKAQVAYFEQTAKLTSAK